MSEEQEKEIITYLNKHLVKPYAFTININKTRLVLWRQDKEEICISVECFETINKIKSIKALVPYSKSELAFIF